MLNMIAQAKPEATTASHRSLLIVASAAHNQARQREAKRKKDPIILFVPVSDLIKTF